MLQLPLIIGGPYEYVGHFTYRDAEEIPTRHAEDIVRKRFAYFVGEVNKVVYGKRWMRKGLGVWGAMAIEKHLSGFPHHHAIIGGDGLRQGIKRVEMMNIWDEHFGIARVWDYRGEANGQPTGNRKCSPSLESKSVPRVQMKEGSME